jgi:steroid 5-alpha reductase family enzyme
MSDFKTWLDGLAVIAYREYVRRTNVFFPGPPRAA